MQRRIGDDFAGPPSRYLLDEETLGEQTLKRALGFLAADQDLTQARINQIAPSWGAYYDPAARVVAVRAIKRSPPVAATLVHEFVHALQHQHFAFDEVDQPTRDAELAFSAILEGDAERIEAAYLATRRWPAKYLFPPALGLTAVIDARGSAGIPQLENRELHFPYALVLRSSRHCFGPGGRTTPDERALTRTLTCTNTDVGGPSRTSRTPDRRAHGPDELRAAADS